MRLVLFLVFTSLSWGAAKFDNAIGACTSGSVTTLSTAAFTIGSGANRAAFVVVQHTGRTTLAGVTVTAGGVSGVPVSGASSTVVNFTEGFSILAPASGSQTASASWTNANTTIVCITIITMTGVDQTTPLNNGAATGVNGTSVSLTITSNSGDLTTTAAGNNNPTIVTSSQTQKVAGAAQWLAADIGPGTGSTTHTWSDANHSQTMVGANFKQAAGGFSKIKKLERMRRQ